MTTKKDEPLRISNMKRIAHCFIAGFVMLYLSTFSYANSVLVSSPHYTGFNDGVGQTGWSSFTSALSAATGNNFFFASGINGTSPDFIDLTQLMSYDALLLQLRNQGDVLTQAEINNLKAFIATGRRVLMIGENQNWNVWNDSILSVVGGTNTSELLFYDNQGPSAYITANSIAPNEEITAGASVVFLDYPGRSSGGTSLYDYAFAMLWGPENNVLTVLDGNVFEDAYKNYQFNGQFASNVAYWLASGPAAVPEPASLILFSTGIGAIGLVAWRGRK